MPEHRIRFRGGWESRTVEGDPGEVRRLTLPFASHTEIGGPIRLDRRFGRPPIDKAVESVSLELRAVPGLRSVHLNGFDLGPLPADVIDWTVPRLAMLEARNTLSLEVVPGLASAEETQGGWGWIALVVSSEGEGGG
jgi:hypothetical protein